MPPQEPSPEPIDPELEALPAPRRPFRRTTLGMLALTAAASLGLASGLVSPARFATWRGPPRELGTLTHVQLGPDAAHSWVHGEGTIGNRAVEYRRPLDADRYRLAPLGEDGQKLWIEMRVPAGMEPSRYVPPNSFVGRLVPLSESGLRHRALAEAIAAALGRPAPTDAWVLFDGEAPATTRWAIGLIALFLAFAAFGIVGFVRLVRPARGDAVD